MIAPPRAFSIPRRLLLHHHYHRKYSTTKILATTTTTAAAETNNERFRVAIIGAGASGMSNALHLAPLVEQGIIAKPIDIFDKYSPSDVHPHEMPSSQNDENFHPGTGHVGREIGIGIWSTALEPFLCNEIDDKPRSSHVQLIKKLQEMGEYVGRVGYRTPNGTWLTKGTLNTNGVNKESANLAKDKIDPSLLFIREKYFLSSLKSACEVEEQQHGTIKINYNTHVEDVALPKDIQSRNDAQSGYLKFSKDSASNAQSSKYNLIIAADGMHSAFRLKYGGHSSIERKWKQKTGETAKHSEEWESKARDEQNAIIDRQYTVFRGNAHLSDSEASMGGTSFQTWGKGKSMRFAAVGMSHPCLSDDGSNQNIRTEKQVWFATILDSELSGTKNVDERKMLLLERFKDWHNPVRELIQATPANKILMERGVAHKHSVYPVLNLAEIICYQEQSKKRIQNNETEYQFISDPSSGPILVFTGDAAMTVDPVLAQGFTIAMESAADLAKTLKEALVEKRTGNSSESLTFDSSKLRDALKDRNQRRYERILCLLRATKLVQAISQPSDFSGFISNNFVRPTMMIVPSFVKEKVFSYVMKYSLGLYGSHAIPKRLSKLSGEITTAAKVR